MLFRQSLTQDQLKAKAPAVFAEAAAEKTSDKYLYIPTYKLIEGLEKHGFQVAGAKQQRSRTNNKEHGKHVVYMTKGDAKSLAVGEEFPMLALTNSHNGLSSFQLDTAFFRLACANGLLMPSNSLNSARVVHKIGMEQDVIDAAYKVVAGFDSQVLQIGEMKQIGLSRDEQMIMAESAVNLVFDVEQVELNRSRGIDLRTKLLTTRRHADQGTDLWTTFNKIQENVIKGGIRVLSENEQGQVSIRRTRAVGAIDRDAKLNKELMALALKMSELKRGA